MTREMLDSQRSRYTESRTDIQFARQLLRVHAATGWLPAPLLALHGLFFQSALAMTWFVVSLFFVPLMKSGRDFARLGLAWFFLAGSTCGLILATQISNLRPPDIQPWLNREWVPLWLTALSLIHLLLAWMLFSNQRVKKAVNRGFNQW